MNVKALFLFLILLLSLALCSFLGGDCNKEPFAMNRDNISQQLGITRLRDNQESTKMEPIKLNSKDFDNYNHYNGESSLLENGCTFTGPNGGSVVVTTNADGTQSLKVILKDGDEPIIFNSKPVTEGFTTYTGENVIAHKFYGPNGYTAIVINFNNRRAIQVTTPEGVYIFTAYTPINNSVSTYYGSTGVVVDDNVNAGAVTGPRGNTSYYATGPYGNTVVGVDKNYYPVNNVEAGAVTGPYGNTAYYATGPQGNTVAGVTRNQIPPGDEDLYILKSQIVPPVCPACPRSSACPREEKCPPCPACARCPEPSFECRKVPNYNAINNDYLPVPVLADFSNFGM